MAASTTAEKLDDIAKAFEKNKIQATEPVKVTSKCNKR